MKSNPRNSVMLDAALNYARHGRPVFPLQGKVPFAGTHGFKDATTDETVIRRWWGEDHPGANIGLATGGNFGWVLDVDGEVGKRSIDELLKTHGKLAPTVMQHTGGGGIHLLFAGGAHIKNSVSKIGPKLDVRSELGYIVAAPSIHPDTGNEYYWEKDAAPWQRSPAPAPKWLEDLAAAGKPRRPRMKSELEALCDDVRNAGDGEQEVTLNNAAFRLGAMVAAGAVEPDSARAKLIAAGLAMENHRGRDPWTEAEIEEKVARGIEDGMVAAGEPEPPRPLMRAMPPPHPQTGKKKG
jgi:hypothetical protein